MISRLSDPVPARRAALLRALLLLAFLPGAPSASAADVQAQRAGPGSAAQGAASAAAAAPAAPIVDPMERLRRRLAERLGGGGGAALSGKVDVHSAAGASSAVAAEAPKAVAKARSAVRPRAAAAPAGAIGAAQAPRAAAERAAAAAPAQAEAAHWGYEGAGGPAAWGSLQPDYALCASGERQSPIDIRDGLAVDLEPVRFDYQASRFAVVDNGHTVQVNVAPGNAVEIGGLRFELVQFHFHRPSEERIDGRQFEMSVHLVHKEAGGRLAVIAVLLDKGPAQPVVQTVWNHLPLERNVQVQARTTLDPAGLLPGDRRYYTYMGSLTTPPCSEGVQWVVMRAPVTAAAEQIELFARIYPMNARPLQAGAGRRILQSN